MRITLGFGVLLTLALGAVSCLDPPEYPLTPEIEFENIVFKDVADSSEPDSLLLFLKFRDGDGNLGLEPGENKCYLAGNDTICFNEKFYFISVINSTRLNYKVKRTNPDYDTLPDYEKPFDCLNWEIERNAQGEPTDTIYFQLNPNHYNIFVDFLEKQPDGSFTEFDWRKEFCTTFDGRFPILAKDKDLSVAGPIEGTLRYAMLSTGFKFQFSLKTVKLRVQIQDRLLNKSNIIETPEFQFN